MLRPWSLGKLVAHLMGQVAPSCLLFWPILWEAWVPGRALRVLEEEVSMSRRSSLPSWYEPFFLFPTFSGTFILFSLVLIKLTSFGSLFFCWWLLLRSVDLSIDLALQGSPNSHPSEELLKQPDYSDKIKQMLGNYQGLGEEACSAFGRSRGIACCSAARLGRRRLDRTRCSARLVFEG